MPIRLGVDLGTTWTAAAVGDGRADVLQLGTHGNAIPSVVALEGDVIERGGGRLLTPATPVRA